MNFYKQTTVGIHLSQVENRFPIEIKEIFHLKITRFLFLHKRNKNKDILHSKIDNHHVTETATNRKNQHILTIKNLIINRYK